MKPYPPIEQVQQYVKEPAVRKFLKFIQAAEGANYDISFGGHRFNSYNDHPGKHYTHNGYASDAAGAFQIMGNTWKELKKKYKFTDFSPATQELAAVALLARRGALDDVRNGNYTQAVNKIGREWASMPSSPYGQPTRNWKWVNDYFAGKITKPFAKIRDGKKEYTEPLQNIEDLKVPSNLRQYLASAPSNDAPPELMNASPLQGIAEKLASYLGLPIPQRQPEAQSSMNTGAMADIMPNMMQPTTPQTVMPAPQQTMPDMFNLTPAPVQQVTPSQQLASSMDVPIMSGLGGGITALSSLFQDPMFNADLQSTADEVRNNNVNKFINRKSVQPTPTALDIPDPMADFISSLMREMK